MVSSIICSLEESLTQGPVTLYDEPKDEEDEEAEREEVEHVVPVAARQKPSDLRKDAWLGVKLWHYLH